MKRTILSTAFGLVLSVGSGNVYAGGTCPACRTTPRPHTVKASPVLLAPSCTGPRCTTPRPSTVERPPLLLAPSCTGSRCTTPRPTLVPSPLVPSESSAD